ncbi:DUF2800 domain-containing protein [Aliibacillus thermotolerans]|uniref:DUF2800 domain-containing protein n=1 Tax=Aliibacillus thermotolerans TaxID=1834418 RepID=A0ABW0U8P8_9BACI|nr:DUF2800 domain-containing protein [Aliibacillus thermotolerans]MDA3130375.1 DUF2800 domain-containing protein [Aliibacillus thermotolerans]
MTKHAILSASGAHRWMNCTPSARLELEFDDSSGEAAKEGTAAHELGEHKLREALKIPTKKPTSIYDSEEMERYTDEYVQFILEELAAVKQITKDPLLLIEQRLDFSNYVPEGFGTGDCVIVADDVAHVIDFKYGQGVLVEAENNPQMMLYALGALNLFDAIYDISAVKMTIYQPRRENISTFEIPKTNLIDWAENTLKPKAELAFKGDGEYKPGDWCRFCRASVECRARAEENLKVAKFEFKKPPLLTDVEIAEILLHVNDLTKWANEIFAYATNAAVQQGKQWAGFKVVEGRSNRKYADEEAVAEAAKKAGYEDIYKKSLLTITNMEKLMGKKKFNEVLGDFIIKPSGKPTLVPVSDKRPEINISTAKNEFMEEK